MTKGSSIKYLVIGIIIFTVFSITLFGVGIFYNIILLKEIIPVFLGPLATVLVGLVAFILYRQQKDDLKKDAANIILLEISSADKLLKIVKENIKGDLLKEDLYLMPTETWSKSKYLFVRDFDEGEWERLNDYYNGCKLFDQSVAYNKSFFQKNEEQIRVNIHRIYADFAKIYVERALNPSNTITELEKNYYGPTRLFESTYMNIPNLYYPRKPISDAKLLLDSMTIGIVQSSIGTKLKRMAGLIK